MLYVRCTWRAAHHTLHVARCASYVARCALRVAHRLADSDHREPLEAEAEGPARLGWPLRILHDLPTAHPKATLTHRHSAARCARALGGSGAAECRAPSAAADATAMHALASTRPVPGRVRPELRLRALRWITPQPSTSSHSPCNTIICHGAYSRQRYGTCQHTMCHMAICHVK